MGKSKHCHFWLLNAFGNIFKKITPYVKTKTNKEKETKQVNLKSNFK